VGTGPSGSHRVACHGHLELAHSHVLRQQEPVERRARYSQAALTPFVHRFRAAQVDDALYALEQTNHGIGANAQDCGDLIWA
jgi:hypothetical protein